jgi:hypothetical protein
MRPSRFFVQQNLPAALAAVPWLLACSALRARRSRTKHKRDACFVLCREALRAHLVTQGGFPDRINDTSVTKRQVNSALSEIIAPLLFADLLSARPPVWKNLPRFEYPILNRVSWVVDATKFRKLRKFNVEGTIGIFAHFELVRLIRAQTITKSSCPSY